MHTSRILFVLAAFLLLITLTGCSGGSASSGSSISTGSVTLSWNPSTTYTDTTTLTPAGYKIYYGTSSGIYAGAVDVPLSSLSNPNVPRYTIRNLSRVRYYFTVCAYDASRVESVLSNEISTIAN